MPAATLRAALTFTEVLFLDDRLEVQSAAEREIVEGALEEWGSLADEPGPEWRGDVLLLKGCRERLRCLIAQPLFRARFGSTWKMAAAD